MFHHHPDGLIIIRSGDKVYIDTVENFMADLGEDYPGLPDGYIGRYYEPGKSHYFTTGNTAYPQPLEWSEGNRYIENIDNLISAKELRKSAIDFRKTGQ
jgi:hypothetical protein